MAFLASGIVIDVVGSFRLWCELIRLSLSSPEIWIPYFAARPFSYVELLCVHNNNNNVFFYVLSFSPHGALAQYKAKNQNTVKTSSKCMYVYASTNKCTFEYGIYVWCCFNWQKCVAVLMLYLVVSFLLLLSPSTPLPLLPSFLYEYSLLLFADEEEKIAVVGLLNGYISLLGKYFHDLTLELPHV